MIPKGAERIEMIDGRILFSTDNWQTVFVLRNKKVSRVTGTDADLARFLAASQAGAVA